MGWFELEPKLAKAGWAATKRLLRRARASWPVWIGGALLASGLFTVMRSRAPTIYDTTVVLRVTEGQVAIPGAGLWAGALRNHLNELVFSSTRLKDLMKRHPERFENPDHDPAGALEVIRNLISITITENDFTEDRGVEDPPRSARVQITFFSTDPEFSFRIARELSDLVIGSTIKSQKEVLDKQQAATLAAAAQAEGELSKLMRADPLMLQFRTRVARDRAALTKSQYTAAMLATRALGERQSLRFEVVDPGEVPARVNRSSALLGTFLSTLFATLLGGVLLAGAFDPRVLDAEDLAVLGVLSLGRFPALPGAPVSPRLK